MGRTWSCSPPGAGRSSARLYRLWSKSARTRRRTGACPTIWTSNAGRVLLGDASLDDVGDEIFDLVVATATGAPTRSEALGHREFQLGYKVFRSLEPSCLA